MNKLVKLLNNLKNFFLLQKKFAIVKSSKIALELVEVLYKEGFISSYKVIKKADETFPDKNYIKVYLKYNSGENITYNKIKFISTPTKLKYVSYLDLYRLNIKGKTGFCLTNQGILTCQDCKKNKIGGVLFAFF